MDTTTDMYQIDRFRRDTLVPGWIIVYLYSSLVHNVVGVLVYFNACQTIQFVTIAIFLGHCLGHTAVNMMSNLTKYRLICAIRYIVVAVLAKGTLEVFTRSPADQNAGSQMCPLLLMNIAFYVLKRSEEQVIADQADEVEDHN